MSLLPRSDSDSEGENPEKKKLQEQLMGEEGSRWRSAGPQRDSRGEGDSLWDWGLLLASGSP